MQNIVHMFEKTADFEDQLPKMIKPVLNRSTDINTEEEAETFIREVNSYDPTGIDGSYTWWLLKQIGIGAITVEMLQEASIVLDNFISLKRKPVWEEENLPKDINQFNYNELVEVINSLQESGVSTESAQEAYNRAVQEGYEVVSDNDNGAIIQVSTVEALLELSKGASWKSKNPKIAQEWLDANTQIPILVAVGEAGSLEGEALYNHSHGTLFSKHGPADLSVFSGLPYVEYLEDIMKEIDEEVGLKELVSYLCNHYDYFEEVLTDYGNIDSQINVAYSSGNIRVLKFDSWIALKAAGANTEWCFSSDANHAKEYFYKDTAIVMDGDTPVAAYNDVTEEFQGPEGQNLFEADFDVSDYVNALQNAGYRIEHPVVKNWNNAGSFSKKLDVILEYPTRIVDKIFGGYLSEVVEYILEHALENIDEDDEDSRRDVYNEVCDALKVISVENSLEDLPEVIDNNEVIDVFLNNRRSDDLASLLVEKIASINNQEKQEDYGYVRESIRDAATSITSKMYGLHSQVNFSFYEDAADAEGLISDIRAVSVLSTNHKDLLGGGGDTDVNGELLAAFSGLKARLWELRDAGNLEIGVMSSHESGERDAAALLTKPDVYSTEALLDSIVDNYDYDNSIIDYTVSTAPLRALAHLNFKMLSVEMQEKVASSLWGANDLRFLAIPKLDQDTYTPEEISDRLCAYVNSFENDSNMGRLGFDERQFIVEYVLENIELFDLNQLLYITYFLAFNKYHGGSVGELLLGIRSTYFNTEKEFKEYLLKSSYVKLLTTPTMSFDDIDKNILIDNIQHLIDEDVKISFDVIIGAYKSTDISADKLMDVVSSGRTIVDVLNELAVYDRTSTWRADKGKKEIMDKLVDSLADRLDEIRDQAYELTSSLMNMFLGTTETDIKFDREIRSKIISWYRVVMYTAVPPEVYAQHIENYLDNPQKGLPEKLPPPLLIKLEDSGILDIAVWHMLERPEYAVELLISIAAGSYPTSLLSILVKYAKKLHTTVPEDELRATLENLQTVNPASIKYFRELGYKLPDFPVPKESWRIHYVYEQ